MTLRWRSGAQAISLAGFWLLAAVALAVLTGCASGRGRVVVGAAQTDEWLAPGPGRARAMELATRNAHEQMLRIVEAEPSGLGQTIGELMAQSPYVTARVRLAIQRCKVVRAEFRPDGSAEVAKLLDVGAARSAAVGAFEEIR